jgi:hypothetical protein
MIIVDSCGWLEWFTNDRLADEYEKYLADQDNILMPAIVLYEVYKIQPFEGSTFIFFFRQVFLQLKHGAYFS